MFIPSVDTSVKKTILDLNFPSLSFNIPTPTLLLQNTMRAIPRAICFTLLVAAITAASQSAMAEENGAILISSETPFAQGSGASDAVIAECMLEIKLPRYVKKYAKKPSVSVRVEAISESDGKVLMLEFTRVSGRGGSGFTGPKSVRVTGKLLEDGETVGTFIASGSSDGGFFGGVKRTCEIFEISVKAVGKDIAEWLEDPTMDAMLGEI